MSDRLVISLAQINPVVGDVTGNVSRIRAARAEAAKANADLVVFSELVVIGYPPEDLVLKPAVAAKMRIAVHELARDTADGGPAMIIGAPWAVDDKLHNAAILLAGGEIKAVRFKYDLPNYGVFDEKRVFDAGPMPEPVDFWPRAGGMVRLGLMICEDMWSPPVAEHLERAGADILIVPNASPWEITKVDRRLHHAMARVREVGMPLIYINQFGGQDELVFDGASFVLNHDSTLAVTAPAWGEAVVTTAWQYQPHHGWVCETQKSPPWPTGHAAIYQAMMLGLRDYVHKNGFPGVVIGLSGGVDSALSAAVAVDALGADKVRTVMMPSRYTSQISLDDAHAVASLLGLRHDTIPIEPAVTAFQSMLEDVFKGTQADATEENIQARVRGILLMAISNKFGHMVLTTGNKSEMSVGYATLYGDMAGGYSVLKDIYKTDVFALSRWRNANHPQGGLGPKGPVMPERVITRPPTAELRADQKDEDSLPPYAVLDDILQCLIEEEMAVGDVVARGHAVETVARVERMLYIAEYKRRQAPPGVKVTRRNFGRDRRYPITNRFRTTS
jgi:NAD+ synthase